MKKLALIGVLILYAFISLEAQDTTEIKKIQYYFNTDPGVGLVGNGGIVEITPTANLNQTFDWDLPTGINSGMHQLFVRTQDQNNSWSLINRSSFYILESLSFDIDAYEYYIDNDPGLGNGNLTEVASAGSQNQNFTVPTTGLNPGIHLLYVRVRSTTGHWSLIDARPFYTLEPISFDITDIEYYLDDDPGIGNGTKISVSPTVDLNENIMVALPGGLNLGMHLLYVRVRSADGEWSLIDTRPFYIGKFDPPEDIVCLEYFVDSDPGTGNGTNIPITPGGTVSSTFALTLPCLISGTHYIYIRAKDAAGEWSLIEVKEFIVGPSNEEICDGLDNDCDGEIDEGFDEDEDGVTVCEGDCNDNDPLIFPGAICDDMDSGTIDDVIDANCDCVGTIIYDCTVLMLNIGDDCDDMNSETINDVIDANCDCVGTIVYDCPVLMLNIGDNCDDMNSETINDVIDANCDCVGSIVYDCPVLMLNIGDDCDDQDAETINDVIDANCDCVGTIVYDCPVLMLNIGDDCDDMNSETINDVIDANCDCVGSIVYDCPVLMLNIGDDCDDQDAETINDVVDANCDCVGSIVYDCPILMLNIGDDCDDMNSETINDVIDANCNCVGTNICELPVNNEVEGAILNTPGRIWGVPGWDTFDVECATLSKQPCDGGNPKSDSWYSFIAEAENQGILVRVNPSDPNASLADLTVEVFDSNMEKLEGLTEQTCAVDRSCFNNYGMGEIERCVPTGLIIGETYYYRVYESNGLTISILDTKVKTFADHPIIAGCASTVSNSGHVWTIEHRSNLYNVPPVPVFFARMVMRDISGNIVSMTNPKNAGAAAGYSYSLSDFGIIQMPVGEYAFHAKNQVKMLANGCISAFWSQDGPACNTELLQSNQVLEPMEDDRLFTKPIFELKVYPNPNMGEQIHLQTGQLNGDSQNVLLDIFDSLGKKVYSESYINSENHFKEIVQIRSNWGAGIYYIRLTVDGDTRSEKIMIE